jgi:hypothetical protein
MGNSRLKTEFYFLIINMSAPKLFAILAASSGVIAAIHYIQKKYYDLDYKKCQSSTNFAKQYPEKPKTTAPAAAKNCQDPSEEKLPNLKDNIALHVAKSNAEERDSPFQTQFVEQQPTTAAETQRGAAPSTPKNKEDFFEPIETLQPLEPQEEELISNVISQVQDVSNNNTPALDNPIMLMAMLQEPQSNANQP